MLAELAARFSGALLCLTLGADGVRVRQRDASHTVPAQRVAVVDTTGAGDTFIGFCLAGLIEGLAAPEACRLACRAAALCVTRPGAMDAIPRREEL
jgi:ribokinase